MLRTTLMDLAYKQIILSLTSLASSKEIKKMHKTYQKTLFFPALIFFQKSEKFD